MKKIFEMTVFFKRASLFEEKNTLKHHNFFEKFLFYKLETCPVTLVIHFSSINKPQQICVCYWKSTFQKATVNHLAKARAISKLHFLFSQCPLMMSSLGRLTLSCVVGKLCQKGDPLFKCLSCLILMSCVL